VPGAARSLPGDLHRQQRLRKAGLSGRTPRGRVSDPPLLLWDRMQDEDTLEFGPSRRALAQRRALAWFLAAILFGAALLGLFQAALLPGARALAVLVLAVLAALLGWALERRATQALLERRLLVKPQSLELRRGAFARFVVFESLRHARPCTGGTAACGCWSCTPMTARCACATWTAWTRPSRPSAWARAPK